MIILDTNVISELIREAPEKKVRAWIATVDLGEVTTTSINIAELLSGVAIMPQGKKRAALELATREIVAELAGGRVESFDEDAAQKYAMVLGQRFPSGHPIEMADAQIAAICLSRNAALATRNIKDFLGLGLTLIDPWKY